MKTLTRIVATTLLAYLSLAAQASDLVHLQSRWAEIHYQLPTAEQAGAYASLAAEAESLVRSNPDNAPVLIWQGMILRSWAGAEGGLGALDKVKRARSALLKAQAAQARPGRELADRSRQGEILQLLARL